MSLDLEDSDIDYDTIEYLKKQANATKSPITVIHYDESSAWIITGDQQGYVAGWNVNLECIMPPIGVHDDCVTMILPHPSVSGFLTYSYNGKDSRLQVWSCNFRGKTEAFTDLGKMNSITINRAWAAVVTIGRKLNFLIMQQLYCFFAPLSSLSKSLLITQNPMYSTKIITISKDNSIRIFSSYGKQLNVQILPNEPLHVVAAAYSGNNNELYTIILKSGEILVSDASVCPIKFRNVFASDGPRITCITLYEYFDEIRGNDRRPKRPRIFYPICIRIIVGTEQGNIIVLNNKTGKHGKNYSAHNGSVIQLHSSVVSQRVISLGIDRSVKVWRVFADLSEPLALYYTLYFIVPITKVSSMGYILCMVNSSKNSTYHQVLMENMTERVRLEHHSSKDHTATIIDMITLETLKICATSSLDNTIRIWDEENCLVKILIINTCAWNTVFSSIRGDIVFSAGRHLYKIPYKNYLSPKYRANIVADEIPKEKYEDSVPEDLEYKIYEDTVDRNNILHPISNTPLISLNIKNSDNLRMDLLIEKQVCALYRDRDEDIKKIRDNILKPAKLPGNRALMTTDIWEKYVNDLLSSITRPIPETPVYDFHNIVIKKSEDIKTYNERGIFYMLFGYSIDELDESENVAEIINNARLPLHGFLPNSILYKPKEEEVFEVESVEIIVKKSVKYQYPPEFYPKVEEEDVDKRESVRLSQLMAMDNVEE